MVNYSQSIIYKIVSNNPEIKELYIGSTTNFSRRKCQHKTSCNNIKSKEYNFNVYQFIRANGGWVNFDMVQIEQYNATDKHSLHARERYWIEELKPSLNCCIPSRTRNERYQDNRDTNLTQMKKYNQQIKEMRTCVCGGEYNFGKSDARNKHFRSKKHNNYITALHQHLSELMSQS